MDNFAEQLVKKNETAADKAKRIGLASAGVAFAALVAVFALTQGSSLISLLGMMLAVVTLVGTYFAVQSTKIEYEYSFTNGELDIDKIIAKKKRRELLTVEIRKVTDFGKYGESVETPKGTAVIFVSNNDLESEYYADFQHETLGDARLVFVPNEKMLANIRKFLPIKLRVNVPEFPETEDETE